MQLIGDIFCNWIKAPTSKEMEEKYGELKRKCMTAKSDKEQEIEVFKEAVKMARETERKFLVFFIDNLDRCNPENAMRLLESIKNHLNVSGCIFVLALDPVALSAFIKNKYHGAEFGTYAYLEKIFSFTYSIPTPDNESILKYGEEKIGLPEHVSRLRLTFLLTILSKSRKLLVPRRMNRILMRFDLFCSFVAEEKAKESDIEHEPRGTAIWICIYEGWPELFLWARTNPLHFRYLLRQHVKDVAGKDSELVPLEGWAKGNPHIYVFEEFANDQDFKEFIRNLAHVLLDKKATYKVNQTALDGSEIDIIKMFLQNPIKYLRYIPITGIP